MTEEPTIDEILAAAFAIADAPRWGTPLTPSIMPVATTLADAHFRAECEQRAVATTHDGYHVTVYPIGMRPA